jgi:transketolase
MMGDGETNEGSVWEAAMMAVHECLGNLVLIIDRNRLQSDGLSRDIIDMGDMAAKWKAFGWETRETDGHDVEKVLDILDVRNRPLTRPFVLVAHTVKGKGVSFFENNNEWHHNILNEENYKAARHELDTIQRR